MRALLKVLTFKTDSFIDVAVVCAYAYVGTIGFVILVKSL